MIDRSTKIIKYVSPDKKESVILLLNIENNSRKYIEQSRFEAHHPGWSKEILRLKKVGK